MFLVLSPIEGNCAARRSKQENETGSIGAPLQEARIRSALDAALLSDAELLLGAQGWRELQDPFPAWEPPPPSAAVA